MHMSVRRLGYYCGRTIRAKLYWSSMMPRVEKRPAARSGRMALEGNLRDMALADLLQVFWMGSKTGILLLIAGPERGVIYVRDGRLIDAVLVRGPRRQVA